MPRKFKQPLMTRYVLMIGLGLAVTACTPRVANRGNNPDAENLAEIKTGESNRQDVAEIIGAPTLTSSFDSKEWYYVSQLGSQHGHSERVLGNFHHPRTLPYQQG